MNKTTLTAGPGPGIDWTEIHHRLERATLALEQNAAPTPEKQQTILKQRTKSLARSRETGRREEEELEVVEFLLASERYAIESLWVREVYPLKDLTPLPGTPPFVSGIINVRGQIVSVIDLKVFFDLPAKGLTDLNKVIIVSDGRMEFGLLADVVAGVRRIPLQEIQPPLPTLSGLRAEYLKGVTSDALVVLNAAKLLADPKINVGQSLESGLKGTLI